MDKAVLEKRVEAAIRWIREHEEQSWAIAGVCALSVILVVMILRHQRAENEEAWNQLGGIQGQLLQGQVGGPKKALEDWTQRFGGTRASAYAKFLKADLLYRTSDYTGAAQVYGELVQSGRPAVVQPLALSAEVASEEMANRVPQAQALAQTFIERYPDHFLAAPMYITQARLAELAGNAAAATAIYERFLILYPQSPWTALARARTQMLGASQTAQPATK